MDSLTQIVLGAAVGEAVLGNKLGNKAMLLGAIAGTIPDLDVLAKLISTDPIFELKTHRAYSHSLLTHVLISFPLAWLAARWSKADVSRTSWYWFWFLGLFTHALLDCCTTYGTRLFLPFSDYQVAFNNISVIDPLYTIPWLILLIAALFYKRNTVVRNRLTRSGWILSSAYMLLTFFLKWGVHTKFKNTLKKEHISYENLNSTPTILNAMLWSGIAYDDDSLSVAEYSWLNRDIPIKWARYKRHIEVADRFPGESMDVSLWFSDGQYFFEPKGDTARMYMTKFGRMNYDEIEAEKAFLFYSIIFKDSMGNVVYKQKTPRDTEFDYKMAFKQLSDRIGLTHK